MCYDGAIMLKVYNTLSRKKEVLKPFDSAQGKKLTLFVCGVTAYDLSHIGHARTYIAFDMIVKYLRQKGLDVFYLQNVTDVDDKIIQRAKELGGNPRALARKFEKEYRADMKKLGVNAVTQYARATDYIPEIISQVERLLKKGYAYEIEGDGIYFDISKFKEYGKLSRRTSEQAQDAVSRIDESVRKLNKGDFALWKLSKPGEPKWKSPWGWGRPGWHIEDTAITEKFFGPQYDVHGGAQDLIFPHHEAEIAQMEAVSGKKPLVRYWMHTGFLTVKREKMSKSLGNFITIRDFLKSRSPACAGRPRLLRYIALKTHYRSPIDYSEELLKQAENELTRIDEFVDKFNPPAGGQNSKISLSRFQKRFWQAMEDDFNAPVAIAVLFDLIREANIAWNKGSLSGADAKEIPAFLKEIDSFFGFIFWDREKSAVPAEIEELAKQREAHRKHGNFQEADALRATLQKRGWFVEDTPSGFTLKKLVYQKQDDRRSAG